MTIFFSCMTLIINLQGYNDSHNVMKLGPTILELLSKGRGLNPATSKDVYRLCSRDFTTAVTTWPFDLTSAITNTPTAPTSQSQIHSGSTRSTKWVAFKSSIKINMLCPTHESSGAYHLQRE